MEKFVKQVQSELEKAGFSHAVAIATKAEVENGSACGQLSIISETESEG